MPYEEAISVRTLYKTSLENLKAIFFLPHFVYFTLAAILFLAQIAVIAMCEEDAEKRKQEYKEGIKYLALPILLLLCDIHSDWVYSY